MSSTSAETLSHERQLQHHQEGEYDQSNHDNDSILNMNATDDLEQSNATNDTRESRNNEKPLQEFQLETGGNFDNVDKHSPSMQRKRKRVPGIGGENPLVGKSGSVDMPLSSSSSPSSSSDEGDQDNRKEQEHQPPSASTFSSVQVEKESKLQPNSPGQEEGDNVEPLSIGSGLHQHHQQHHHLQHQYHPDDQPSNSDETVDRSFYSESLAQAKARKEAEAATSLAHSSRPIHHHHNHSQKQPPPHPPPQHQHQPEGWRVKLYRLNSDGSWDDCGTGRIVCLYKRGSEPSLSSSSSAAGGGGGSQHPPPQQQPHGSNLPRSSASSRLMGDAWIYQELGEPTLCMQAEVNHGTAGSRILLRTRILLRDAYQRQGENIITWCEPYLEEGNPAQGVDLALSFQDNAGCLDIWRQITLVQSKAADLYRRMGGVGGGGRPFLDDELSNEPAGGEAGASAGAGSREHKNNNHATGSSASNMSHGVAAAHRKDLRRQQQDEIWVNVASEGAHHHLDHPQQQSLVGGGGGLGNDRDRDRHFDDAVNMVTSYHDPSLHHANGAMGSAPQSAQLPNPPLLVNLEEIADTIAAVQHSQQREALAMFISQNDCSYLKSLLSLFPSAESRGDYGSLATLAACVKTILLLNDPSIIQLIVSDELIFEEVCATLEYDPDLRDKANHRWFLRERAKFRTVALMEDEELVAAIHRSFRVDFLRDTLLRPTMDESSLSTLSSLQTFTHADVVKGVTMSPTGNNDDKGELLKDSYLAKVIRVLGRELEAICMVEWEELERLSPEEDLETLLLRQAEESPMDKSTVVATGKYPQSQEMSTIWKQHLAPQDASLASRRTRRRGSIAFLRELFNMVRLSLQQSDKDDFFAVLVSMEVDLDYDETPQNNLKREPNAHGSRDGSRKDVGKVGMRQHERRAVNLLSLLGNVLADPNIDVSEKSSVLEIVAGIAMHDPSLLRRRCLDFFSGLKKERNGSDKFFKWVGPARPSPNEVRQIIFQSPPDDILSSLLFLLAVDTDAGILLQVSEIMRIILDTDILGEHGQLSGIPDEPELMPLGGVHGLPHEHHINPNPSFTTTSDQNQFLSMFYDHYIHRLAAPFQFKILYSIRRIPIQILCSDPESPLLQRMKERFSKGKAHEESLLRQVASNSIRSSFAVELLSFCVRAHLYPMKRYLLRSRVLSNVLKLLKTSKPPMDSSGDRCLKLAALRFFRAILSVNDEFYHRHIIEQDLFAPVFEAFRENPVGDNLVSSAIVEICDYIQGQNIKSLLAYIVTKHMSANTTETPIPSLEEFSRPYVNTLTFLREAYEENLRGGGFRGGHGGGGKHLALSNPPDAPAVVEDPADNSRYFHGDDTSRANHLVLNEKAREDQRKYREVDQEESYFDNDDDDDDNQDHKAPSNTNTTTTTMSSVPSAVDEVEAQEAEADKEVHRSPRSLRFTLPHSSRLNGSPLRMEQSHQQQQQPPEDQQQQHHMLEINGSMSHTDERKTKFSEVPPAAEAQGEVT